MRMPILAHAVGGGISGAGRKVRLRPKDSDPRSRKKLGYLHSRRDTGARADFTTFVESDPCETVTRKSNIKLLWGSVSNTELQYLDVRYRFLPGPLGARSHVALQPSKWPHSLHWSN